MSRSPPFFRSPWTSTHPTLERNTHRRENSSPPTATEVRPDTIHRSHSSTVPVGNSTAGIRRFEQRRTLAQTHFLQSQSQAQMQALNPPVDMRLLDYVAPGDENLMCPICRCPFVDPVVLAECDHCFCRDCIRQTWTTSSTPYSPLGPRGDCPTCRRPGKLGPRSATSKILVNILDDLVVKCPKSDEGCAAQVKRGEVQDHVSIYCGYTMIECLVEQCRQPVMRKASSQGCLHYAVSCIACRQELQKSGLETHWRSSCPDRQVTCDLCKSDIFYRELEEHNQLSCPAISVACPGKSLGCTIRNKQHQAEIHASNCTFAKLAPIMNAQRQRMDEQEAAQKQMSRRLEVLEDGFSAMQGILSSKDEVLEVDELADQRPITPAFSRIARAASPTRAVQTIPATVEELQPQFESRFIDADTGADLTFPPPSTTGGPYTSPLHHLLSMHESLREEMSHIQTTLQELDGRHSTQILNENLRTREEISYLGAQIAGLQRQVHWLTSVQLQRQHGGSGTSAGGNAEGSSVDAALSAVNTAVRLVNAGRSTGRSGNEEGRTKL